MKILVADDSRVMRQIVVRTLRQAGFAGHEVVEAENGRELVDKVGSEQPDIVLSDWNMPEMNGIDALDTLRASGSTVPFGFVTSEGSDDMRARAAASGAAFLIAKPFTAESFGQALNAVFSGTRAPVELSALERSGHGPGGSHGSPDGQVHLPSLMQFRELLSELLNRDVHVRPSGPLVPSRTNPCSVALYVDDRIRPRAVAVADLAFSAFAGAAIGLLPAVGAVDSLEAGELSDTLAENLYEVLNIASSMFNVPDASHLKLHVLHPIGVPCPPDALSLACTLGRREDLEAEITGYGRGHLSVVVLP